MSEETKKLPNRKLLLALFKESASVKEKTSSIAGAFGDRIKSAQENGNLNGAAFRAVASIYRKAKTNELAALDMIDHVREYLDAVEEDIREGGHVGNLDDLARMAPVDDDDFDDDEDGEPVEEVRDVKRDGIPLDKALEAFEGTKHLAPPPGAPADLDDDHQDDAAGSDEPAPPPPPVNLDGERKRRGRPKKNALPDAEPQGSYTILN
ncbi:hypothetical protein ACUSIJ_28890 [Pseudochelatococcus sp. B33]